MRGDSLSTAESNKKTAVASRSKYLDLIDKLQKRAFRYGYIGHVTPIRQIIEDRDLKMWTDMTSVPEHPVKDLLPTKRKRSLRKRNHEFILPKIRTERFKNCFVNRCLFK